MADNIDIEQFIDQIKKSPQVWDVTNEVYRDKQKKTKAWRGVCRHLYDDFEDRSEDERKELVHKIRNKWRNIRDTFVRSVKKQRSSRGDARRSYVYAKQLAFLRKNYIGEDTSNESRNIIKEEPGSVHRTQNVTEEASLESDSTIDMKTTIMAILYGMRPPMVAPPNPQENIPGDTAFFESLVPITSRFDIHQKLEFRCEVMRLVQRIQMQKEVHGYCDYLLSRGREAAAAPAECARPGAAPAECARPGAAPAAARVPGGAPWSMCVSTANSDSSEDDIDCDNVNFINQDPTI